MNALRNVWIALRTTPPALWWIAATVLAFLFTKIYVFDSMRELFPKALEVGKLFQNLGEATLAALIFFVFSYQLPYVMEQRRVGPAVIELLGKVAELVFQPLRRVFDATEGKPESDFRLGDVDEKFVERYFTRMDRATLIQWLQALKESDAKCRQIIVQIWRYSRFVDPEILGFLNELELSEYSESLPLFASALPSGHDPSLSPLARPYFLIFDAAIRLARATDVLRYRFGIAARPGVLS